MSRDPWFKRSRRERRMDNEFRFHLDSLAADYVRQGLSRREAKQRARRDFGATDLAKDECRDQRPIEGLDHFLRDIGYAGVRCERVRDFARRPF
jgi:putative ABC transport system permease protein